MNKLSIPYFPLLPNQECIKNNSMTKNNPNLTLIKFQSTVQANLSHSWCDSTFDSFPSIFPVNGGPYSLPLPSNEEAGNDWIWVLVGIFPTKWLKERFKYDINDKLASWIGISPLREFCDRSKDSNCFRLPIDMEFHQTQHGLTSWGHGVFWHPLNPLDSQG